MTAFSSAATSDPQNLIAAALAERRLASQLRDYLTPTLFDPMVKAYTAGLAGEDAPTDNRTPQGVVLAYLLGDGDKDNDLSHLS